MPHQSRGKRSATRAFSDTFGGPPTLGPFLDNLPPSSTISDQRTPTGPLPNGISHKPPPTSPTHNSSHFSSGPLDGDEDDKDDSVTLDDADFQSSPASTSSEDLSDIEDGIPHNTSPFSSPLHHTTSSQSLPPPPPPPLYPPFYNRPPTPLPPSPSLTSLLRPPSLLNRSTTSTRPTTP